MFFLFPTCETRRILCECVVRQSTHFDLTPGRTIGSQTAVIHSEITTLEKHNGEDVARLTFCWSCIQCTVKICANARAPISTQTAQGGGVPGSSLSQNGYGTYDYDHSDHTIILFGPFVYPSSDGAPNSIRYCRNERQTRYSTAFRHRVQLSCRAFGDLWIS